LRLCDALDLAHDDRPAGQFNWMKVKFLLLEQIAIVARGPNGIGRAIALAFRQEWR
jgi:hypothetical protein